MNFSNKLLHLREKAGMSQEDLAEMIKVPEQMILRWESGTAIPDAPYLIRLSGLFGVSIEYLLHEDFENNNNLQNENKSHSQEKNNKHNKIYLITSILMYISAICFFLAGGFTNIYLFLFAGLLCVISASGFLQTYFKNKPTNTQKYIKD